MKNEGDVEDEAGCVLPLERVRFPLTMRHNNCSKVLVKNSSGGGIVEASNALKYDNIDD
jgi:hypothetical protein